MRSIGPNDAVTGQPVKGRKRGGGIRFGEMERDALIAHGVAFLMQDRFMNCSDARLVIFCLKPILRCFNSSIFLISLILRVFKFLRFGFSKLLIPRFS